MKSLLKGGIWGLIAVLIFSTSAWALGREKVIKVGINAPITGDIPKVGEGTKYAAQMWLADIEKAGGLEVGGNVGELWDDNKVVAESVALDVIRLQEALTGQALDHQALIEGMVNYILNGVSPVEDAPALPEGYWDKLQSTSERRITLAGYRIADLILSAADQIEAQRKFMGR